MGRMVNIEFRSKPFRSPNVCDSNTVAVEFSGVLLAAISLNRRADASCCRKPARHGEMHPGRKVRVDESYGVFSLAFGVAGFVSLRILDLGAAGLVYANAINMLCRIVWSGTFIARFFEKNGTPFSWTGILPGGAAVTVEKGVSTHQAQVQLKCQLQLRVHRGRGGQALAQLGHEGRQ